MRASKLFALALVAVGVLLAAAPSAAQTFRVVAFGDSLTSAYPFDLGSGSSCRAGSPDSCGFVGRLPGSAFYGCGGSADCAFTNRGVSGERTSAGVTRIDRVLREKEWDLLILLQGTNDIAAGVSPQAVRFNLAQMAEKARRQQVGVAMVSPIWINPSIVKTSTAQQNNSMSTLRSLINSEAGKADRCFVDAWSKLCPAGGSQQGCFNNNYWQPPTGLIDHVGHPNSRGYDILTKEFFRVLGSPGDPGSAAPISPTDEACGEKLTLTWQRESQARARCGNWYRIQVQASGGTRFNEWIADDGICGSSECKVTLSSLGLREGNHSFRVQTRNAAGYGPWSDDQSFFVVPRAPNQIDEIFGPPSGIYSAGGIQPEFVWGAVKNAVGYRLEVSSPSAGLVLDEALTGEEECNKQQCKFTPSASLSTGRYTWRVLAENICGGTWSESARLDVFDSAPTVAPKALSPGARTFDATPTLRWEPVVGATEYEIQDPLGANVVIPAADACQGDTCRYLSPLLVQGSAYTWRVRANNPLGSGVWSETMSFSVAACDCVEGKASGGSLYLMAVPENWNGDLVIWAARSNRFGVREVEELGPLAQRQFDEGYAVATTSFTVSGWPLYRSERDLAKLYSIFIRRFSRPGRVYVAGESAGALAATQALQKAKLGNLVGALSMCGPLAGATNWEGALDLRLAYDAVCAEVPGAEIPGAAKGLPNNTDLTPADVASAVGFCTGIDKPKSERTNPEKQRLKELLGLADLTEEGLVEAIQLSTFGLADLVRDKKKSNGKVPVGNEGVDYDGDLDTEIERVKADAGAERKLADLDLSGATREAKVVALHTSLDPVFFPENLREAADLLPEDGLLLGHAVEASPSHCGFTEAEELAAWKTLTTWAEGGKKPQPKNLQRRCKQLQSVADGPCRFENRPKLDPLDERIRPRP